MWLENSLSAEICLEKIPVFSEIRIEDHSGNISARSLAVSTFSGRYVEMALMRENIIYESPLR
jgi:hypothetical protein